MGQILLSVPHPLHRFIRSEAGRRRWAPRFRTWGGEPVFVGADPQSRRLGSGGGTVNLLAEGWRAAPRAGTLSDWLASGQRLVLHAGGESRRLPSYAAIGKAFLPMPAVPGLEPRRFDQMLADFQVPSYRQVLLEAGRKAAVLVTSGDVWLDFDPLQVPVVQADIVGIGMRVSAEVASHFGVFFVDRERRDEGAERPIEFFLQKPRPEVIYRHSAKADFYVDTGMWLLSERAVNLLFRRCGWNPDNQTFRTDDGSPGYLDLYTEIGTALGRRGQVPPALRSLGFSELTSAVIGLDEARFYHLGSNRQLFESFEQLQRGQLSAQRTLVVATPPAHIVSDPGSPVWVDAVARIADPGAGVDDPGYKRSVSPLRLQGHNLAVGLPPGSRVGLLAASWCVEAAPVDRKRWVVRPFHVDDTLRGAPGAGGKICGQDAAAWLATRGFPKTADDVFQLSLYPLLPAADIDQPLIDWFFAIDPDPAVTARVLAAERISAARLPEAIDFGRFFAQRDRLHAEALRAEFTACLERGDSRVFAQDCAAIADFCRMAAPELGRWIERQADALRRRIVQPEHASRLQLLLAALATGSERQRRVDAGYRALRDRIVAAAPWELAQPVSVLKDDQIVWARSPVRLDLAGGWTDTPPYCFERGGSVLNVAVLLNGQPPIQVFVRPLTEPLFRLKSIDLGSAEEITTYERLETFKDPRSGFSLPKAALTLAGFHPQFAAGRSARTLRRQLERFGGGLEISLLSAVPKGSGLGTSSILGATLLGALNRACGLGWDEVDLYRRVLGVEQLLTTGGGWQDQAGALFRGVKLIQTGPGLGQTPTVRYVSEHLLGSDHANHTLFLYYTGVTRLAQGILKEIVHDMFLGRGATLRTLALIRANADHLHRAMQEGRVAALQRGIARSWELNQRLDPGTSTPEIERIIARAGDDLAACKLLGAGGGGYMLMCAKSAEGGKRIRDRLESRPPNPRARFIDFKVSDRALEVTVS